jgi:phosphoribosyl 1,2-cyclic phosphodiesterase
MRFYNLTSGSRANATLIQAGSKCILIDTGASKSYLVSALQQIGYCLSDIDLVLITHFHQDHCKSLSIFDQQIIFSLNSNHHHLLINQVNEFDDVKITPFLLSHDKACLGYQIEHNGEILTYLTDTGYVKNEYLALIAKSTYLILEFNHDIILLNQTDRPYHTKQRIMSDKGHLNNEDAAVVLVKTCDKLEHLLVAHISEKANSISAIEAKINEVFNNYEKEINFKIDYTMYEKITSGGK